MCSQIERVKEIIESKKKPSVESTLDYLFPEGDENVAVVRKMLLRLKEDGDTTKSLYDKSVDCIRTLPEDDHTIRVITLIGSKGLDAERVLPKIEYAECEDWGTRYSEVGMLDFLADLRVPWE